MEANQMQPRTRHQCGKRCMNSKGDMAMWVVPSRQGS
jgi:hypothetical protein